MSKDKVRNILTDNVDKLDEVKQTYYRLLTHYNPEELPIEYQEVMHSITAQLLRIIETQNKTLGHSGLREEHDDGRRTVTFDELVAKMRGDEG